MRKGVSEQLTPFFNTDLPFNELDKLLQDKVTGKVFTNGN
jgi:hypothetical protein